MLLIKAYRPYNTRLGGRKVILKKPANLNDIPEIHSTDPERKLMTMTKKLGGLAGSERLYVNIDYVRPGDQSAKYHSHSLQEEFFLILKGSGTLRIQGETFPVRAGDFLAKPAGRGIAHQFINDGTEVLEILDCGTVEFEDVAEYPDEDILLVRKTRTAFHRSAALKGWSSDPNE
jgi:uncharacterized cupin superfamily protein